MVMADPTCSVKGCTEVGLAFPEDTKKWLCRKHWLAQQRTKMRKGRVEEPTSA